VSGPGRCAASPGHTACWVLTSRRHTTACSLVLDNLRHSLEEGVIRVARAAAKVT
jgi:hypothetical protein